MESRELIFRAWNKKTNQMRVSPSDVRHLGSWFDAHLPGSLACVDDVVLMQYTGLVDKNGTRIFEGDIVKFSTSRVRSCYEKIQEGQEDDLVKIEWKSPVEWEDGAFCITESFDLDQKNDTYLGAFAGECEVLANIYEPETSTI